MINAIQNYLILSIEILFWWITASLWHELMHVFGGWVQGGVQATIYIDRYKHIPTMQVNVEHVKNRPFYLFAGGFFTSILFLILSYCYNNWILFAIAFAQLLYSFYECYYRDRMNYNDYMFYHYLIYILGGTIGWIIWKSLSISSL